MATHPGKIWKVSVGTCQHLQVLEGVPVMPVCQCHIWWTLLILLLRRSAGVEVACEALRWVPKVKALSALSRM